jgi:hypothetical protein
VLIALRARVAGLQSDMGHRRYVEFRNLRGE